MNTAAVAVFAVTVVVVVLMVVTTLEPLPALVLLKAEEGETALGVVAREAASRLWILPASTSDADASSDDSCENTMAPGRSNVVRRELAERPTEDSRGDTDIETAKRFFSLGVSSPGTTDFSYSVRLVRLRMVPPSAYDYGI